jgi:hypothetical protein
MTRATTSLLFTGLLALGAAGPLEASPIVGQIDTFEGLTTNGWTNGPAAPDPLVLTGGPSGATDHFLDIVANGLSGPGGKITAFNRAQWAGDFLASGIQQIEMDLKNLGQTSLDVRVGFRSGIALGAPAEVSTVAFVLAPDSLWHHAVFAIDDPSLSEINGASFGSVMSSVMEMRILHSVNPFISGDPIVSQLGVDNIRAVGSAATVPEPTSMFLLGSGMLVLLRHRNRFRTQHS